MPVDALTRRLLEEASTHFQGSDYIRFDPVSVPHGFDDPRDQEIIGLFAAILAWGRRDTMLRKLEELCERMAYTPSRFVHDFRTGKHDHALQGFKHRTFQTIDAIALCRNLRTCLHTHGTIEELALTGLSKRSVNIGSAIEYVSQSILAAEPDTPARLRKHLARPSTGSACKRLSMYFRWMVRPGPFDLGVWNSLDPSLLVLPLDVHSGRQARMFGLLSAASDNWKGVLELTAACRTMCKSDPSRYDFALFGLGAYDLPPQLAELFDAVAAEGPTSR
jgi:uncharacterized protein (TIGR02757 family)